MTVVYPEDIPMTPEEEEYWEQMYPDETYHADEYLEQMFEDRMTGGYNDCF